MAWATMHSHGDTIDVPPTPRGVDPILMSHLSYCRPPTVSLLSHITLFDPQPPSNDVMALDMPMYALFSK